MSAEPPSAIQRFALLLTTPLGLDTTLATTCYASLLVHTQLRQIKRHSRPVLGTAALKNLYNLLEDTRICTRLTGILTLYSTLTQIRSIPHIDLASKLLVYASLAAALGFQILENIALLAQHRILRSTQRFDLWTLSSRFWVTSLICDLVRLVRERYLEHKKPISLAEPADQYIHTDRRADAVQEGYVTVGPQANWWRELCLAALNLPLAINWSFKEGKSPVNEALLAASGLVAALISFDALWKQACRDGCR